MGGFLAVALLYLLSRLRSLDRCKECGERCSPLEADFFPRCYDCIDTAELLREIRNG